jgi:(2R)-sulfolactate sulfo-lyase subunit alpha
MQVNEQLAVRLLTLPGPGLTVPVVNRRGLTMEVPVPDPASSPAADDLAFLVHNPGDDVAVAVRDTDPGGTTGAYLASGERFGIDVREAIPLGHKIALRDLAEDESVTEYGVPIGLARGPIQAGTLVHTHNLRSARWRSSV